MQDSATAAVGLIDLRHGLLFKYGVSFFSTHI